MNRTLKIALMAVGGAVGAALLGGGSYAALQTTRFDSSVGRVYEVALPTVPRSPDSTVVARGKHLVESVGGCASKHCHGADLGGGDPLAMGPLGTLVGPNITMASLGAAYSDGELARLIEHGIKKDGRS